jgi:hypothetical protein
MLKIGAQWVGGLGVIWVMAERLFRRKAQETAETVVKNAGKRLPRTEGERSLWRAMGWADDGESWMWELESRDDTGRDWES